MKFGEQLARIGAGLEARTNAVFQRASELVLESIVDGSSVTGAPGQPVDKGALRDSWSLRFESPTRSLASSSSFYARAIEYDFGGMHYKNHGPHSVALTRTGFARLVDVAVRETEGLR